MSYQGQKCQLCMKIIWTNYLEFASVLKLNHSWYFKKKKSVMSAIFTKSSQMLLDHSILVFDEPCVVEVTLTDEISIPELKI